MSPKDRDLDDSMADEVEDDESLHEEFESAIGDEDGTDPAEAPTGKAKRLDRVRASVQSANIEPGQSSFSTKWAIDRLDEREKRFSFAAAGGAALFGVIIYLAETQNHNFRLAKGQITPQTTLIVGLVAAGLLIAATILGRRAPAGFVALFTGAAFGGSFLFLGLPFFALAVWLLYRSYKIQRETAGKIREARAAPRTRSSSGSRPAASPRPATATARGGPRSKGPPAPAGNKRYTPKRPLPPPPKPSRRARKAAASD
jgi:hypothetical protein